MVEVAVDYEASPADVVEPEQRAAIPGKEKSEVDAKPEEGSEKEAKPEKGHRPAARRAEEKGVLSLVRNVCRTGLSIPQLYGEVFD